MNEHINTQKALSHVVSKSIERVGTDAEEFETIPPMTVFTDTFDPRDPQNARIMLSEKQRKVLQHQWEQFWNIKQVNREKPPCIPDPTTIVDGDLIHMTSPSQLNQILRTGVLATELLGGVDDGETFYCADFWRPGYEGPVRDVISQLHEEEQVRRRTVRTYMRNPLDRVSIGRGRAIALVFDARNSDLTSLRAQSATGVAEDRHNPLRTTFSQVRFPGESASGDTGYALHEAILCGLPSDYIKAIILSERLERNQDFIAQLRVVLKDCGLVAQLLDSKGSVL